MMRHYIQNEIIVSLFVEAVTVYCTNLANPVYVPLIVLLYANSKVNSCAVDDGTDICTLILYTPLESNVNNTLSVYNIEEGSYLSTVPVVSFQFTAENVDVY